MHWNPMAIAVSVGSFCVFAITCYANYNLGYGAGESAFWDRWKAQAKSASYIMENAADECLEPLRGFSEAMECARIKTGNYFWVSSVFFSRWADHGAKSTALSAPAPTKLKEEHLEISSAPPGLICRISAQGIECYDGSDWRDLQPKECT